MAVRTKELGAVRPPVANVVTTYYTCPAGHTAIVKELAYGVNAGATMSLLLRRGAQTWTLFNVIAPAATTFGVVNRWLVLEPGDQLQYFFSTTSGNNQLWVSGSELDGVA